MQTQAFARGVRLEAFLEHRDQRRIARRVDVGGYARRIVPQPGPFHGVFPIAAGLLSGKYGRRVATSISRVERRRKGEASDPPRRTGPADCRSGPRGPARSAPAAPRKASNSSRTVRSGRSRVMNTSRVRWSSSGQRSSRAVGWKTCCTPCTTTGVSGISASFTMPLRRNSLSPWVARSSSRNISSVPAGNGGIAGEHEERRYARRGG